MTRPPHWSVPRVNRLHSGVFVARVVAAEIAVAAAVAAARGGAAMLFLLPAMVALLAAAGSWGGCPATRWPGLLWAFHSRRRTTPVVAADADPALVPVLECVPGLAVTRVPDRAGSVVAMVGDGTFLTALLQVESDERLAAWPQSGSLPLDVVASALAVDDVRLDTVQVVQHTGPTVGTAAFAGGVAVPAVRVTWVALRLEPRLCPRAVAARGGGTHGAERALLRAVNHTAARLSQAGFKVLPLDDAQLVQALATACGADPGMRHRTSLPRGGRRTMEARRSWRCDGRVHRTWWVRDWHALVDGSRSGTVEWAGVPDAASTFSWALRPGPNGRVRVDGHLRITAPSRTGLGRADALLRRHSRVRRTWLVRLDFEQQPAALATLPLGGCR